ncbi:exodeoxyribonuclease V subunit gamma, partial [Singulisphaera rosea]
MIHVWYSNQLERLAGRLVANLGASREDARSRLFAMPPIIVPGQVLENYLRYEIAQGAGIAAGLEFYVPETFLRSLLPTQAWPEVKLLDEWALRAFFLDGLEVGANAIRLPEPVRAYLDAAGGDVDARELRRFQLATRLSRQFAMYGEDRPERLRARQDEEAERFGEDWTDETVAWPQALWGHVGGEGGLIQRARDLEQARWLFPFELYPWLDENGRGTPAEVHVFGFSHAWGGFRRLLAFLDRTSIVHVYAPTPGIVFRDDLGPRVRQGELFSTGPPKREGRKSSTPARVPFREDDPDDLPIVREWGRPVGDFFRILGEREGVVFHPEFPTGSRRKSILNRLRRQILLREWDEVWTSSSDESLAILACPGIRREAEVVAGEIWRMIAEDDRQQGAG